MNSNKCHCKNNNARDRHSCQHYNYENKCNLEIPPVESPNVQEGKKGAPNQGTLKETVKQAAERVLMATDFDINTPFQSGFILGAQWQAGQSQHSYTEADKWIDFKNGLTPPELWLQQRSLSNSIISHPHAGDQYVQCVSDVMREYVDFAVSSFHGQDVQDTQNPLKTKSYSEAELLAIIEQVKKAFADNSGSDVVAKSITDIDFKYLLK